MAQHQHILCSSNSGSGGSCSGRSKSGKPKKIPQRGLGVAQLEKIRIEEQRKKLQALEAVNKTFVANESVDVHQFSGPNLHHGYATFWPPYGSSSQSQIEPPSNQSSNYASDEPCCKIVGVKRPYPFSPDNSLMQVPYSFSSGRFLAVGNSGQSCLCSNGCTSRIRRTREGPLNSSTLSSHPIELGGDFLTLALPTAVSPDSNPTVLAPCRQEKKERQCLEPGSKRSVMQQPMRLFPMSSQTRNEDGTKGEGAIDLNLKL